MKHLLIVILCMVFLTGCAGYSSGSDDATSEMPAVSVTEEPVKMSFLVYYGDENGEKLLFCSVQTNEITENTVLAALIGQGVLPAEVTVNSLELTDDLLVLDFNQEFQHYLCSQGTSGEWILMGSVVNTFLNAYEADAVVITVDGTVPESGHMIYDSPMTFFE